MFKTLIWLFVAVLLLSVAGIAFLAFRAPTLEDISPVGRGAIRKVVRGSGKVEGCGEVIPLCFARSGRIDTIYATEGQDVDPDTVLAELNPSELTVQLNQAQAKLSEALARLDLAMTPHSPEAIRQAEERLATASADVKSADNALHSHQSPPVPPSAQTTDVEEATRNIGKANQKLTIEKFVLQRLTSSPTADELAVAQARVDGAQAELDGAKKLFDEYKVGVFGTQNKTQLQVNVELAKKHLGEREAERDLIKRGANPADVETAKARVAMAQLEVDSAEALRERLVKPVAPLPSPEHVIEHSRIVLAQAQAKEREAKAALDELKRGAIPAEIAIAESIKQQAEQALKLAKLNFESLKLRAPSTGGLIVKRYTEPGAIIAAFTPVLSLLDFSQKRIRAEFDIARLADIKPDMHVTVTSRAFKETMEGKVVRLGNPGTKKIAVDDPTVSKGGEVFEAVIELDEPKTVVKKSAYTLLRPGLRVDVEVTLERHDNVIVVPIKFVSQQEGKEFVWTIAGSGSSHSRRIKNVKTGLRDELFVEITDGLNESDMILKPIPLNVP